MHHPDNSDGAGERLPIDPLFNFMANRPSFKAVAESIFAAELQELQALRAAVDYRGDAHRRAQEAAAALKAEADRVAAEEAATAAAAASDKKGKKGAASAAAAAKKAAAAAAKNALRSASPTTATPVSEAGLSTSAHGADLSRAATATPLGATIPALRPNSPSAAMRAGAEHAEAPPGSDDLDGLVDTATRDPYLIAVRRLDAQCADGIAQCDSYHQWLDARTQLLLSALVASANSPDGTGGNATGLSPKDRGLGLGAAAAAPALLPEHVLGSDEEMRALNSMHVPAVAIPVLELTRSHIAHLNDQFSYRPPVGMPQVGAITQDQRASMTAARAVDTQTALLGTHTAGATSKGAPEWTTDPECVLGTTFAKTTTTKQMPEAEEDRDDLEDADLKLAHAYASQPASVKNRAATEAAEVHKALHARKRPVTTTAAGVDLDTIIETSVKQIHFTGCHPTATQSAVLTIWNRGRAMQRFKISAGTDSALHSTQVRAATSVKPGTSAAAVAAATALAAGSGATDAAPEMSVHVLTSGYSSEVAIPTGSSIQVQVDARPHWGSRATFESFVNIAHVKDENSIDPARNARSVWLHDQVPVLLTCAAPRLSIAGSSVRTTQAAHHAAATARDAAVYVSRANQVHERLHRSKKNDTASGTTLNSTDSTETADANPSDYLIQIPPCYIGSTWTETLSVTNTGGAGVFVLSCAPNLGCFTVTPERVPLKAGETRDVKLTYQPTPAGGISRDGCLLQVESFLLPPPGLATGAAAEMLANQPTHKLKPVFVEATPVYASSTDASVVIESFGDVVLARDGVDASPTDAPIALPAQVHLSDVCAGFTASRSVVVRNCAALPVTVSWRCEQIVVPRLGGARLATDAFAARCRMVPSTATILPGSPYTFRYEFDLEDRGAPDATSELLPQQHRAALAHAADVRVNASLYVEAYADKQTVQSLLAATADPMCATATAAAAYVPVPAIALAHKERYAPLVAQGRLRAIPVREAPSAEGDVGGTSTVGRVTDGPAKLASPFEFAPAPYRAAQPPVETTDTGKPAIPAGFHPPTPRMVQRHYVDGVVVTAAPSRPSASVLPTSIGAEVVALVRQPNVAELTVRNECAGDLAFFVLPRALTDILTLGGDGPALPAAPATSDTSALVNFLAAAVRAAVTRRIGQRPSRGGGRASIVSESEASDSDGATRAPADRAAAAVDRDVCTRLRLILESGRHGQRASGPGFRRDPARRQTVEEMLRAIVGRCVAQDGLSWHTDVACGVLAAGCTRSVRVTYTALHPGSSSSVLDVFIPALGARSPSVTLHATARGPTVRVEPSAVEFGSVPLGAESEARFVVSNPTPNPVFFRAVDARTDSTSMLMADASAASGAQAGGVTDDGEPPQRLFFAPPHAVLRPNESSVVTVYFRGITAGAVADLIRLEIEESAPVNVPFSAHVQPPILTLTPGRIRLGRVSRGVAHRSHAVLSNPSSEPLRFEIVPVRVPAGVYVSFEAAAGVIAAGVLDMALPFTVSLDTPDAPATAVFGLKCPRLGAPVLLEIACTGVEQPALATNVILPQHQFTQQSTESFVRTLLENAFETAVEIAQSADVASVAEPARLRAFVDPVRLSARIDDVQPYCVAEFGIALKNASGCAFHVETRAEILEATRKRDEMLAADGPRATVGPSGTRAQPPAFASSARVDGASVRKLEPGAHSATVGSMGKPLAASFSAGKRGTKAAPLAPLQAKALALPSHTAGRTFTTRLLDGTDAADAARNELLASIATTLTAVGRGAALQLTDSAALIAAHGLHQVSARFVSNLPGVYRDSLTISAEGLPTTHVPLELRVFGAPIVIDPNTSGMRTDSKGGRVVHLPTLVAGMRSVKRTLMITSRSPRDVQVTCSLSVEGRAVSAQFFAAAALGGTRDVTAFIAPKGAGAPAHVDDKQWATFTPREFLLPALQSKEIVVEYMPPPGAPAQWHATLTIDAVIVQSSHNDKFLIAEFYEKNDGRYESQRALAPLSVLDRHDDLVRGVPKIPMRAPVVVRNGAAVVAPTAQETAQLRGDLLARSQATGALSQGAGTRAASATDDDEEDVYVGTRRVDANSNTTTRRKNARLPTLSQTEVARMHERLELAAFMERSYAELASLTAGGFMLPTSVQLAAKHAIPTLEVDPAGPVAKFAPCLALPRDELVQRRGDEVVERNTTMIRLRNAGATPIAFRIGFAGAEGEQGHAPFTLRRCVVRLDSGKTKSTVFDAAVRRAQLVPAADEAVFTLLPLETLDVTTQLTDTESAASALRGSLMGPDGVVPGAAARASVVVTGALLVQFTSGEVQRVPLEAPLHLPALQCLTPCVVFRPTLQVAHGRAQPQYDGVVTIVNTTPAPAPFTIRPRQALLTTAVPLLAATEAAGTVRPPATGDTDAAALAEAAAERIEDTAGAVRHIPRTVPRSNAVDVARGAAVAVFDPSKFALSAWSGVVPACARSGAPTSMDIAVRFTPYATHTFTAEYDVDVEGGVGTTFAVLGESRVTEL